MIHKKYVSIIITAGFAFGLTAMEGMLFMPVNSNIRKRCYSNFYYSDHWNQRNSNSNNTSNSCNTLAAAFKKVNQTAFIAKKLPKIKNDIKNLPKVPNSPIDRAKLQTLIDYKTELENIIKKDPNCSFQHFPNVGSPEDIQRFELALAYLTNDMNNEQKIKELQYVEQGFTNARENKTKHCRM